MILNKKDGKLIKAAFILEIIGRPPEHLAETLAGIIKQIEAEKGVKVVDKKINEPVLMKEQKDFYTSFAEIEVDVEDVLYLAILMFKYMPAHIEIISPEEISLANSGWNDIFNELARRLHGYDEIARILQMEKTILENKLREVFGQKSEVQKQEAEEAKKPKVKKPKAKNKK
jgi:hypothetical protein